MSMWRMPNSDSASEMALIITASAGVVPPSPPALMPSGLVGECTSTISSLNDGSLWERGIPYSMKEPVSGWPESGSR